MSVSSRLLRKDAHLPVVASFWSTTTSLNESNESCVREARSVDAERL
jgi:hypothetical protein